MSPPLLFLSYRRSDCLAASNALRLALVTRYGARAVFRDYERLEAGEPWPDQLRDGAAGCKAVLALIGGGWDLPRLDDPADWVRQEVEAGVRGNKLYPLFVDGANPPAARWPAGCALNVVPTLQAFKLRNTDDFDADVAALCAKLEAKHPELAELAKLWRGRFQLPPVVSNFVGRQAEIDQLKAALRTTGRAGVSALRGMGGVGKTTLAVKVATELLHDFPDGVFKLDLMGTGANPRPWADLMREVIRVYRPTQQPPDEADAPHVFREVLAEQRVLILLDNAGTTPQVKPLLQHAPPTVGFLITSRNTLKFDTLKLIPLDALPLPEAVALLREVAGRGTDAELEAVAGLCGRLPLALRVAGDFLRLNDHWPVPDYVADLEAHRLERLADEDDAERDVRTVLKFSLDLLAKQKPEAAARYALLSVFPAGFDEAAAKRVLDLDATAWRDTATVLRDRSLLDFANGRFRVHDLLRILAGAELSDANRSAAGLRFAKHYRDVQAECQRLYFTGNDNIEIGLKLFDLETENIAHGREWCHAQLREPRSPGSVPDGLADLISLYALNAQLVHDLRLSPSERKELLEAALTVLAAGGQRVHVPQIQFRLALVHQTQGKLDEALRLLTGCVAIAKDTGREREQAVYSGVIADVLQARGELDEALRIRLEECIPVYDKLGDIRTKAVELGFVAAVLQARGQLDEALRIRRKDQLPVYHRLGDVRGLAVCQGKIADVLQMRGQLDEALRIRCEEVLPIYYKLGDVHSIIVCRANIAQYLEQRHQPGDRAEAVEHLRWALAEAERLQLAEVQAIRQILARVQGGGGKSSGTTAPRKAAKDKEPKRL